MTQIDGYLLKTETGIHLISDVRDVPGIPEVRLLENGLGSVIPYAGAIPDHIGKKSRAQIDELMNEGFALWARFQIGTQGLTLDPVRGSATFVRLLQDGQAETRHLQPDDCRMVDAALGLLLRPGLAPVPDGLRDARTHMLESMRQTLSKVQEKYQKETKNIEVLDRDQRNPELAYPAETYQEYRLESVERLVSCDAHEASLKHKLDVLERDPEEFFLPIGSIVEFTGAKTAPNSLALLPDQNGEYPAAGSRGLVTALGHTREWGVAVTMRSDFKTADGYQCLPSYDRTVTFRCDREQLRVVGQALLPDGTPFSGYDWQPTHGRTPSIVGEREEEMVLEADGYFWRLHDFGGTQSIEVLQAYDDIAEMSWLTGPLPQYLPPQPEDDPGPGF